MKRYYIAFIVGVLYAGSALAQTAPTQVEMYLGPTLGKQWHAIFSNHPRIGIATSPALTTCGTTPAIVGNDTAGEVTMGTGSPTGCVITFNTAYTAAPLCTVTWQTNIAAMAYAVSTTAITLTQTGTSSNIVNYHCFARSGG